MTSVKNAFKQLKNYTFGSGSLPDKKRKLDKKKKPRQVSDVTKKPKPGGVDSSVVTAQKKIEANKKKKQKMLDDVFK